MISKLVGKCYTFFSNKTDQEKLDKKISKLRSLKDWYVNQEVIKALPEESIVERFQVAIEKSARGGHNLPSDGIPTLAQQRVMKMIFRKEIRNQRPLNIFEQLFYVGEEKVKWIKELADGHKGWQKATNQKKSKLAKNGKKLLTIFEHLGKLGESLGANETFMEFARNKLNFLESPQYVKLKQLQNREYRIARGLESYEGAKGPLAADRFRLYGDKGDVSLEYFLTKGEGQAFKLFVDYAMMPAKRFNNLRREGGLDSITRDVVEAVHVWRDPVEGILPDTINSVKNSLNIYESIFKENRKYLGDFEGFKEAESAFIRFKEALLSKDFVNDGLFPVLAFDILPNMMEALPGIITPKDSKHFNQSVSILGDMTDLLQDNIYLRKKLKDKNDIEGQNLTYNIVPMIDSWIKSVADFEFKLSSTKSMLKSLKFLHEAAIHKFNTGEEGPLQQMIEYHRERLNNDFNVQLGTEQMKGGAGNKIVKFVTMWEFFDKLGFNPVSIGKQITQGLLIFPMMLDTGLKHWRKHGGDDDMKKRLALGLEKTGLKFANIEEFFGDNTEIRERDPETGGYRMRIDDSFATKFEEKFEAGVRLSGKGFSWFENNFNRTLAYNIGYIYTWTADKIHINRHINDFNDYQKRVKKRDLNEMYNNFDHVDPLGVKKGPEVSEWDIEFERFRRKRAENGAFDMVNFLHFDYSQLEKAQMFRVDGPIGKAGPLVGLYLHYPMKFYLLQKKVISEAIQDTVSGQAMTDAQKRLVSMGFYNTLMIGMIGPFFNLELGNIFENDTWERGKKWYLTLQNDDRESINRAWYYRGFSAAPLGAVGGDLITLGHVLGVWDNVKRGSIMSHVIGNESERGKGYENSNEEKLARLFNSTGAKAWFRAGPRALESDRPVGTFVREMLNLTPRADTRKKHRNIKSTIMPHTPVNPDKSGVNKALDNLMNLK